MILELFRQCGNFCFHFISLRTSNYTVRIQHRRGVLEIKLCDKVCQWLAAGQGFSPCNPVYSSPIKLTATIYLKYISKVAITIIVLHFFFNPSIQMSSKILDYDLCIWNSVILQLLLQFASAYELFLNIVIDYYETNTLFICHYINKIYYKK